MRNRPIKTMNDEKVYPNLHISDASPHYFFILAKSQVGILVFIGDHRALN